MTTNNKLLLPTGVVVDYLLLTTGTAEDTRNLHDLLRIAKLSNKPALCCCRPQDELRISICKRDETYYLARFPDTGPLHHHGCYFYAAEAANSGVSSYAGGVITEEDGVIKLRLAFGLNPTPSADPANREPARLATGPVRVKPHASALGLLHLLWETARLNRFNPERPHSGQLGWLSSAFQLGRASTKIAVGRAKLNEHLFVLPPNPGKMEVARYANLSKLDHKRLVLVARFYSLKPSSAIKGMETLRVAGTGKLAPSFFINVPSALADSTRRSYANQIARAEGKEASNRVICIAVGDFAVITPKPNPLKPAAAPYYRLTVQQLSLMSVNDYLIPVESSYEQQLADLLCAQNRTFTKPLRYDADTDVVFPDFILNDTPSPCPLEVYGMTHHDYLVRRQQKIAYYQKHFPGAHWAWDADTPMPPLPAKA